MKEKISCDLMLEADQMFLDPVTYGKPSSLADSVGEEPNPDPERAKDELEEAIISAIVRHCTPDSGRGQSITPPSGSATPKSVGKKSQRAIKRHRSAGTGRQM